MSVYAINNHPIGENRQAQYVTVRHIVNVFRVLYADSTRLSLAVSCPTEYIAGIIPVTQGGNILPIFSKNRKQDLENVIFLGNSIWVFCRVCVYQN